MTKKHSPAHQEKLVMEAQVKQASLKVNQLFNFASVKIQVRRRSFKAKAFNSYMTLPYREYNHLQIINYAYVWQPNRTKSKVTFTKCGIFCGIFLNEKILSLYYQGLQLALYFLPFRPNIIFELNIRADRHRPSALFLWAFQAICPT